MGIAAFSESLALLEQRRKKLLQNGKIVRLGMMRHLNIILDCSDAMLDQDLKPTRQMCTLKVVWNYNIPISSILRWLSKIDFIRE